MLRSVIGRVQRGRYAGEVQELPPEHLTRTALVVSPHQDDETLGCGGTVLRKRDAGADVTILFLMDGRRSHKPHIEPERLSALRHGEGLAAAERLGVDRDHVVFLDFPEGNLFRLVDEAVERLTAVLDRLAPEEVYVPAAIEPKEEHAVANEVTRRALARHGREVTVFEFPVWCWYSWPAVPLPLRQRLVGPASRPGRELPRVLANTRLMGYGARIWREFTTRVPVQDVLDRKRAALDEHRTQMTRLRQDRPWATLSDVGGGAWLECFFTGEELFRRYVHLPGAGAGTEPAEGAVPVPTAVA